VTSPYDASVNLLCAVMAFVAAAVVFVAVLVGNAGIAALGGCVFGGFSMAWCLNRAGMLR
jgi:hypothetical protein